MNRLKIGMVQHSFSSDVDFNRQRNIAAIENLADEGADLVVLSELHDSLYFCQCEDGPCATGKGGKALVR